MPRSQRTYYRTVLGLALLVPAGRWQPPAVVPAEG